MDGIPGQACFQNRLPNFDTELTIATFAADANE